MRWVLLVLVAFPVLFAAIWMFVLVLLGTLGGWRTLGSHYAATAPFEGRTLHMQNGWMGIWGYGWSLTAGANSEHLHLEVMRPFRICHPTLDIPLSDVTVTVRDGLGSSSG